MWSAQKHSRSCGHYQDTTVNPLGITTDTHSFHYIILRELQGDCRACSSQNPVPWTTWAVRGTGNSRCLLKTKHKIHLRSKQACFPAALAQVGQVLPVKFCSQLLWWESFKYQQATAGNTESQNGNLEVCTLSAMWHLLMKGFALSYPYREPKSGILKNGQFNIACPNLPHVWGTWHCSAVSATGTSHSEDKMWICSTSAIPWEFSL